MKENKGEQPEQESNMKKYNGWNDNKSNASGVGGQPGPFEEPVGQQGEEREIMLNELNRIWEKYGYQETWDVIKKVNNAATPPVSDGKEIEELISALKVFAEAYQRMEDCRLPGGLTNGDFFMAQGLIEKHSKIKSNEHN